MGAPRAGPGWSAATADDAPRVSGADGFRAYAERRRPEIEAALAKSVDRLAGGLPAELGAAARDGALGGGKRIRPLLLLTAYDELGGAPSAAVYELACAPEFIHAYSLMHDDLPFMDDAPLRRGRPSCHAVHGVPATVAAGALLVPWAARCAWDGARGTGASDALARDVAACLLEAAGAGGMIGGQALDLEAEGRDLDEAGLERLHGLKTGRLIAASLVAGAMAAGADAEQVDAVARYGRRVGLAFQVMDDVLDATSSAGVLGKRPSDAQMAKSTYVALLGVAGARAKARRLAGEANESLDGARAAAPRLRQAARFIVERRR